ncbi:hypothetical protein QIS74_02185 [Colletotrichum tabaci]|uniref:Uncharacterized protein n=1 Tax=Colletotrichum tabaci TaxID=1209068 RepID=A0AAV9TRX5_9PEZI
MAAAIDNTAHGSSAGIPSWTSSGMSGSIRAEQRASALGKSSSSFLNL